MHGKPERFMPNQHTDPDSAAALSRHGKAMDQPIRDGRAALVREETPVDLSHGALAAGNGGNYLLVMEMPEDRKITVGSLGGLHFGRGWYVYAWSARKNPEQRLSRHLRKVRKWKHWHVDYITPYTGRVRPLAIISCRNLERDLVADKERLGEGPCRALGVPTAAAEAASSILSKTHGGTWPLGIRFSGIGMWRA
jgi:sugar fermentation stimulation protein A